jgi:hypothetical protein
MICVIAWGFGSPGAGRKNPAKGSAAELDSAGSVTVSSCDRSELSARTIAPQFVQNAPPPMIGSSVPQLGQVSMVR